MRDKRDRTSRCTRRHHQHKISLKHKLYTADGANRAYSGGRNLVHRPRNTAILVMLAPGSARTVDSHACRLRRKLELAGIEGYAASIRESAIAPPLTHIQCPRLRVVYGGVARYTQRHPSTNLTCRLPTDAGSTTSCLPSLRATKRKCSTARSDCRGLGYRDICRYRHVSAEAVAFVDGDRRCACYEH